jgi:hypothetical protein
VVQGFRTHERGSITPLMVISPPAKGVLSIQGNASSEGFHHERGLMEHG